MNKNVSDKGSASDSLNSEKKVQRLQVVTLVDAYTPITVHDQYGNPYMCLNYYEVSRVLATLLHLQKKGETQYDTGDWWLDLPPKMLAWGNDLDSPEPLDNTSTANPPKSANLTAQKEGL